MVTSRQASIEIHQNPDPWIREVTEFANSGLLSGAIAGVPDARSDHSKFRDELQADLTKIAGGYPLAPEARLRLIHNAMGLQMRVVGMHKNDRSIVIEHSCERLAQIASYTVLMLYEQNLVNRDAFPGDLHKCKQCGKFFFTSDDERPKGGRPRTEFCSDECMNQRHSRSSVDRVRAYRERERLKAAAKHK